MTVLPLQVGASSDDAVENDSSPVGAMDLTDNDLRFGNYVNRLDVGLRFTGVSGLQGATINPGTQLTFRAHRSANNSFVGDWYAEDAAAPGTFTTAAFDISNRTKTTATCGGDAPAHFGNWTFGQDHTFVGDGVNTIADIIQELATDHDPSAIVLLHIYTSGFGERRAVAYDGSSSTAPKLDIDYTADTGDQTATPDPVAVPVSIPAPTLVAGGVSLSPDPVALLVDIPLPSVVAGGIAATPDPVAVPVAIPAPTLVIGGVTATPDAVAVPIVIPDPQVVGAPIAYPDPVVVQLSIPTPTVVIGGITATPDPVTVPLVIPTPQLDWQANPSPVTVPLVVPTPSMAAGGVALTPDPVTIPIVLPLVTVPSSAEQFVPWGIWDQDTQTWLGIEMFGDPDDFVPGSVFRLTVGMYTSSALVPVKAYLYNVTDGVKVAGSDITGTSTVFEILRSGTFNLPTGGAPNVAGLKKYRLEFGGQTGGIFHFHGGKIDAESS